MKIKVSKHKLNIHYRGSPWGSRTQQHAYCLRYAHSQHIESHLGKKQPQAKIPIAFLFSQLHFNNVTSHALIYGGHLVMRSKRCAVQNQGITIKGRPKRKIRPTERLLCFCILFYFPMFYKRALTNSYVWPLHYTASQYLIESFTVRCIISLRRDIGKQTITFFANNNYNTIFNLLFFKIKKANSGSKSRRVCR